MLQYYYGLDALFNQQILYENSQFLLTTLTELNFVLRFQMPGPAHFFVSQSETSLYLFYDLTPKNVDEQLVSDLFLSSLNLGLSILNPIIQL